MKYEAKVIRQWIETIETEGMNLTQWEEKFIADVSTQGGWSEKQVEIIERIYAEKTA